MICQKCKNRWSHYSCVTDYVSPVMGHWTVYRVQYNYCQNCTTKLFQSQNKVRHNTALNYHEYPKQFCLIQTKGMSMYRQTFSMPSKEEMQAMFRKPQPPVIKIPWSDIKMTEGLKDIEGATVIPFETKTLASHPWPEKDSDNIN